MKHFGKIFGVSLLALFAVMILSAVSFAGSGSAEAPPGSHPYGVVMHGDAKGVKLYGSISVEYIGNTTDINYCPSGSCAQDSKVVLQLHTAKDTMIDTFYQQIPYLPLDPQAQADALLAAFRSDILNTFFGGDRSQKIVLVSFGEFQVAPSIQDDPNYIMASITLAVSK